MGSIEIDNYLNILVNQPLRRIGRAANMLWIGFGETLMVTDSKGHIVEKNSISLHVQCAWRMVDRENKTILFASSDIYAPNSSTEWTSEFDWDIQGINLFDEKSKIWIDSNARIYIKDFKFNMWGDLLLFLSNGNILDIYVNNSTDKECWRLFEYKSGKDHFVVNGMGFVFE